MNAIRKLIERPRYLEQALMFRDTDLVKVITGVRRCGKSSLLELVRRAIQASASNDCAVVGVNLESKTHGITDEDSLYQYCRERLSSTSRTYFFIDEPQLVPNWQKAINAIRVDFDCDIYITGSNAYLLSSELATYLAGRYVEIKMLPLSFEEYLYFCNVSFPEGSSVALVDGSPVLLDDVFARYLLYGGMPATAFLSASQAQHEAYMASLYDTVAVRDILRRSAASTSIDAGCNGACNGHGGVNDALLLDRVAKFLSDNIGNATSVKRIADTLTSSGAKTTNKTVHAYVEALCSAYLFYTVSRYDLHGKAVLQTQPKHYIADLGMRSYLDGYRSSDVGRVFENAVFLQLLYKGWLVHVGKIYNKEVDFVAIKDGRLIYVQVADEMFAEETKEREIRPLRAIRDNHEKMVVVRQGSYERDIEGIRVLGVREFFLEDLI